MSFSVLSTKISNISTFPISSTSSWNFFLVYFESFSFGIVDQGFAVEKVFHGPVDVGGDVEVRFRFRIFRARGVNHLGVDVENRLPAEGSAANRTGHLLA